MNPRGYVLAEVLLACVLLSLAAAGLYLGLMQAIKAEQKVRLIQRDYDPVRLFSMRIEKDLCNAVSLGEYAFQGKDLEMSFPVIERNRLLWVRYFFRKDRR